MSRAQTKIYFISIFLKTNSEKKNCDSLLMIIDLSRNINSIWMVKMMNTLFLLLSVWTVEQ